MAKKQRRNKKILAGALIALLLLAGAFFAFQFLKSQKPDPNSPLIGTWTTDFGRVVNFRADGTARYRGSANGKANQILYFEWTVDELNRLALFNMGDRPLPFRIRLKQRLTNWISGDDDREPNMKLVEVAKSGFTLQSTEGVVFKYTPAEDKQMESAP